VALFVNADPRKSAQVIGRVHPRCCSSTATKREFCAQFGLPCVKRAG